jgi:translation initiation factor 1 (eIF-1/SUI1)
VKTGGTDRLTAGKDLLQVLQSDPADAVQTIKTDFIRNTGTQTLVYSGAVQQQQQQQQQMTPTSAANPNDGKIQLFFKTLTNRTRVIRAKPDATILELKQSFFDSDGVPVDAQRLIWGGKELEDERTLQDYNIQQESTIYPVLRLRGGSTDASIRNGLEEYLESTRPVFITTRKFKGNKCKTTIAGLDKDLDWELIAYSLKKKLHCSACIQVDKKTGEELHIELSGKFAQQVGDFLVQEKIVDRARISRTSYV